MIRLQLRPGWAALGPRVCRTAWVSCFVNPRGRARVAGTTILFAEKTSLLCGAEYQRQSRVSAHLTQEVADAKRQVFGAQQVWASTKVRRRGIEFLQQMPPAARFSAETSFEKQHNYACTLTAITWLRCGLDSARQLRWQRVPKHRCTRFFATGEEVFRRRRDKCM
jgi:hypothetical protein